MGGGNNAHIGFLHFGATHTLKGSLLQNSKQLHLHVEGHVTDFVKKQRTALG